MLNRFNILNGSVKIVSNDVFEIKRFIVLFQRLNLYLIGAVLAIPFIFYNLFDEQYIDKRKSVFNYEAEIKERYEEWVEGYNKRRELGIKGITPVGTYKEYYDGMLPRYYSDFFFIYGSMAVTILPWLFILFWPAGAPVRVDRKRQLIYTRHWFRLYASRFDQLQPEFPQYSASMERAPGPLIIHLYRPGKTHTKKGKLRKGLKLRLGLYYPQFEGQNREIYSLMDRFMEYKTDIPEDFKPKKGWLEYSLVPMRNFPNEKRLNKALDNWWDKEQYPQLCPAIEWMVHYVDELEREGKLLAKPVPIEKQSLVLGGQQSHLSGIIRDYP